MLDLSVERILAWIPAVLIALTFHEYAHGWMALRLGDHTARLLGRLTLNPIRHLDPIGTLLLFLVGFGWAKPVPVNPYNFRGDIKRGLLLVSAAGPAANLILACAGAVLLGLIIGLFGLYAGLHSPLGMIVQAVILVNLILAFFNLLPIPPLDGSKILAGLLPGRQTWLYSLEQYGIIILLVLVVTGVIRQLWERVIEPAYAFLFNNITANIAGFLMF